MKNIIKLTIFSGLLNIGLMFHQVNGQTATPPELKTRERVELQLYRNNVTKTYVWVHPEGEPANLPVDLNSLVVGSLPVEFTTKRLEPGRVIRLPLQSMIELSTRFDTYLSGGEKIYVEFTGRKAGGFLGLTRKAYFEAQAKSVLVNFEKPVVLGENGKIPIVLREGRYELSLNAVLVNIQAPGSLNYNIPLNTEGGRVKAPRNGKSKFGGICEEQVAPMVSALILSFPSFVVCHAFKIVGAFVPDNWEMPIGTTLVFKVDAITARRLPGRISSFEDMTHVDLRP